MKAEQPQWWDILPWPFSYLKLFPYPPFSFDFATGFQTFPQTMQLFWLQSPDCGFILLHTVPWVSPNCSLSEVVWLRMPDQSFSTSASRPNLAGRRTVPAAQLGISLHLMGFTGIQEALHILPLNPVTLAIRASRGLSQSTIPTRVDVLPKDHHGKLAVNYLLQLTRTFFKSCLALNAKYPNCGESRQNSFVVHKYLEMMKSTFTPPKSFWIYSLFFHTKTQGQTLFYSLKLEVRRVKRLAWRLIMQQD